MRRQKGADKCYGAGGDKRPCGRNPCQDADGQCCRREQAYAPAQTEAVAPVVNGVAYGGVYAVPSDVCESESGISQCLEPQDAEDEEYGCAGALGDDVDSAVAPGQYGVGQAPRYGAQRHAYDGRM